MATLSDSPTSVIDLISSYSILSTLAPWLSTLDLFHLGLTSRSAQSYILASPAVFECLCDGRGLVIHQTTDELPPDRGQTIPISQRNLEMHGDQEIEVRLYIIGEVDNIYCLCSTCDTSTEKEVAGKFLNELCDCDRYTRWICLKCKKEENAFTKDYFDKHTVMEWDWDPEWFSRDDARALRNVPYHDEPSGPSMVIVDHKFCRAGEGYPSSTTTLVIPVGRVTEAVNIQILIQGLDIAALGMKMRLHLGGEIRGMDRTAGGY
ncbi:hypothetical protein NCS56_01337200 [Fusarium sp. Ph1]|nr:hypothetical protein NCS56_01337200 [Fusarium sp. Ph1]